LYKPYSIEDFYSKITQILKNRKTTKKKENKILDNSQGEINEKTENKYSLNENEFIGLENFFIKLNKNAKLFEKIKNHFNNNIKVDLEKLKLYHKNNDNKNLNYLAHKLKSEISNFDFDKITDILREIELSAKVEKEINYELFEELEYYINILIEKFIKFEIN
jgi:HPt (histidine-containing phosphotransfer) domain-containing protein